ncbi:ABC transporter substrate-binding protein, partial [Dehalococcoidia bacterium]|nr:ABC transporter substrate-binding protein [Dehalococcoidia bacterium]MCL0097373.1 ABC transporter substrate-binding protein [Dehalococcoidia bacterium]
DPRSLRTGSGGSPFTPLIYEGLITLGTGNVLGSGLAESWEMSPDGKVWTFRLREGVLFHDGTSFDSEDVKFTAEWNVEQGLRAWWRGLNRVETVDEHTVRFIFDIPRFTFDSELALIENFIMSSTTPLDERGVVQEAIGTGPFKLVSWSSEQLELVRNDDYWGEKPRLEKVVAVVIPDPETRVMALEAGEVDVICARDMFAALPRLSANPALEMHSKLSVSTRVLYMGIGREPFDDLRVRKAINHIIDRKEIVTHLLEGHAVEAKYMFSPAFGEFVNREARNLEHDPEQAKQLLREAGFEDQDNDGMLEKDGEPFSMVLTYDAALMDHRLVAEYLQYEFQELGIKVVLHPVEHGLLRESKSAGDFDLLLNVQSFIPHNEPSNNYRHYFHSTDGRFRLGLDDLEVDALIDQLDATGDRAERLKLHHKLQKEILERAPVVYLYNTYSVIFTKNAVNNFEAPVHSRMIWYSLKDVYVEGK